EGEREGATERRSDGEKERRREGEAPDHAAPGTLPMPESFPAPPGEPVTAETLAAMSHQLLGGNWRQADLEAVAKLLNGLEQDMAAFHGTVPGEQEPVTVYSPLV
ncbi:MAG: hypothetical protein ACREHD_21645, partial [Pirellulales bacterium]